MLRFYDKLSDLCFGELMCVYEEGNCEKANDQYAHMDKNAALLQAEQDFYAYLEEIFFRTPNARYAVWEEGGRYISALRLEPFEDGLLLEALETRPEYRNKGYAKKLILSVLPYICVPLYSHVNKHYEPSLRTHVSCGFVLVSENAKLIDGTRVDYCYTFVRKS